MLTIYFHVINTQSINESFNAILRMERLHIVDTRVLWGDNSISVKEDEKLFSYVQIWTFLINCFYEFSCVLDFLDLILLCNKLNIDLFEL